MKEWLHTKSDGISGTNPYRAVYRECMRELFRRSICLLSRRRVRVRLAMLILAAYCSRIPAVFAEDKHMGVATCSSSNCHGSISAKTSSRILQNEYSTWFRHEAHSRAYEILSNQQSKTIARNLAIGAAESEPLCLNCHATHVPTNLRGNRFRTSDGVGCESCHGAA